MKNALITVISLFTCVLVSGQSITAKLQQAFTRFENDPQLKHAISSLYVIEAETGKVVFAKNQQIGLAPASTQKIITSVTAYELLGQDFRYTTEFSYDGEINAGVLSGNIWIRGSGDPTLGSFRFAGTKPAVVANALNDKLTAAGIQTIRGGINLLTPANQSHEVPDGWIWQDIGNYYGAGIGTLAWHENQYGLILRPGKKEGDPVSIVRTSPAISHPIINELKTGAKGSGDNAYIYYGMGNNLVVKGTVPCCVDSFIIAGSAMNGAHFAANAIAGALKEKRFITSDATIQTYKMDTYPGPVRPLLTLTSPVFDSIIYWFNRKSINLYGEALLHSIATAKTGQASTAKGTDAVRDFWKDRNIDPDELNIYDGSGLSPLNRVTTHAQVEILKFARSRKWFPAIYTALPEYNNMKMKSGTISDVKGFCGYHKSANGKEYIFSFLVNNYTGKSSALVAKMYTVLDNLK